ncbi:MAG: YihY/virulence factor BrkB family protein [Candidatus Binatia bacterium]
MSPSAPNRKLSIEQLKIQVIDRVLDRELSELTRFRRLFHSALKIAVMVGRDFVHNLVKLQAMALAFKTLLSLAPLLAVIFSILKGFGVHNRMEPALAEALAPLGDKGQEITKYLIGFVDKMSAGALGSIGFVTLFVTVLSLMGTIEEAFNHIWRVKAPRNLGRRFTDYLSAIFVGPVLVFAAVTITATLQSHVIVQTLLSLQPLGTVILFFLRLIPYMTLWGAFTFVYIFIPNTRVKLQSALVGGLVAAVLWQTVGWGFATFVASSTKYYAIYSSFAILLLFLLWLHVGWVIVLLGAQVAYAHQHINYYQGDRELLAQSPAGREKLALHLLFLIGRNFYHGLDPMNVNELAQQLRIPAGMVKDLMEMFTQSKLVLPLADEETFVLARAPETIHIKEILDCVRNAGKNVKTRTDLSDEESEINDLLVEVDHSMAEALQGKHLQGLIASLSPPATPGRA